MPKILHAFYQEDLELIAGDLEHVMEVESDLEYDEDEQMRKIRISRKMIYNQLTETLNEARQLGCSRANEIALSERTKQLISQ